MTDLMGTVSLHTGSAEDLTIPTDRPVVVISYTVDADPSEPAIHWEIGTNMALGTEAASVVAALGRRLHMLSHMLLGQPALIDMTPPRPDPEVVHLAPTTGTAVMPCCGRTPFEATGTDRITTDPTLATCTGGGEGR